MALVPPSADLPLNLAAYIGGWEGVAANGFRIAFIIQSISPTSARTVSFYNGANNAYAIPFRVVEGRLESPGGDPSLAIAADLASATYKRTSPGSSLEIAMKPCRP